MKKIILTLIIVIAYILIALSTEYYVGNDIYLFIAKNVRFHYSNGTWTNDANKDKYNKFQLYNIVDNKKIGTYDIKYNDGWYAKIRSRYSLVEGVLMFKGKGNLNILSYEEKGKLNDTEVKKVLKKYNLPTANYNGYYIEVDIDNDGKKEKVYALKNYYSGMYTEESMYYSFVFILDDGNIQQLILDKSVQQMEWTNEIGYILDVNNDNIYEILVSRSDIDIISQDASIKMYGLKDGKYVKLVGTE